MASSSLVAFVALATAGLVGIASAAAPTESAWQAASGRSPERICPPWTLTDTAPETNPVLEAGALLLATAAPAQDLFYVQTPATPLPDPVVVEARVELVSGQSQVDDRGPVAIAITVAPDTGALFFLEEGGAFLTAAGDARGAAARIDTRSPHTYHIEVTAAGEVSVSADGVPLLSGTTYRSAPAFGPEPRILWGEGSIYASGSERWETFAHNALSCSSGTTTSSVATTTTTTTTTQPSPTTTPPVGTTSTTLPPTVCEAAQMGSAIALLCRAEILRREIGDASARGGLRPRLAATADRVVALVSGARTSCATADARAATRRLKQAARLLARMARRLTARRRLDTGLRADLLGAVTAIRTDTVALRAAPCGPGR